MRLFRYICPILLMIAGVYVLTPSACHGESIQLKLAAGVFDPLDNAGSAMSIQSANASGSLYIAPKNCRYYIVQCCGPILSEWKSGIEATGVRIVEYIPDFAYLVRIRGTDNLRSIMGLSFVRWVGPYLPAYKIQKGLLDNEGSIDLSVRMHPGEDVSGVAAIAGGALREIDEQGVSKQLRGRMDRLSAMRLAESDEVASVEVHAEPHILNNVARGIMDVQNVWTNVGLFGAGQRVAVCDTGLDTGNQGTLLADFQGRVAAAFALGRTNDWSDLIGHGTHVAGSVLGSGALSGSNPATHDYSSSFAGIAPEASLVFQSASDSSGALVGVPNDLSSLFQQAYDAGARVHSDSWGTVVHSIYDTMTRSADQFCWLHPDMTVVFAAGNDGGDGDSNGVVDLGSLDTPSTAKNSITVGASESLRSTGGYADQAWSIFGFQAYPISSDTVSNNASGIAAWSSRGPTADGRIKPDLVAPGTNIVSCRSQVASQNVGSWSWGAYNPYYVYLGGSSMSTPLVAGTCALVREYYVEKRGVSDPSSALVKATLINGAADLYPGQYGTGAYLEVPARPNSVEGWGRVDLANSLGMTTGRSIDFVENTAGLSTNGSITYKYTVGSSLPLRVTLVWTDFPASTTASVDLVNDLDLTVTGPDGTVYLGNGHADRINNVEGVDISAPKVGTYTVKVSGYNIPDGPQPFALVIGGALGAIQGTVKNSSGVGISGVQVTAVASGTSTTYSGATDSSGAYAISVPSGVYTVTPSGNGLSFSPSSRAATVTSDAVSGINFTQAASLSISISTPTSAHTYTTTSADLSIGGSFVGSPSSIAWQNSRGGSALCSILNQSQWAYVGVPLQPGENIITVTATDSLGGTATAFLKVFYSTSSQNIHIAGLTSGNSILYSKDSISLKQAPGSLSQITIGDFNGDGLYDLAGIANGTGSVWYTTDESTWSNVPASLSSLVSADFNGDGKSDLAGLSADGSIWYTTDLKTWTKIPGTLSQLFVGDFAGNGRYGLAGMGSGGSLWYTTDLKTWTQVPGYLSQMAVGDFAGNGKSTIAGLSSDGSIWYTVDNAHWTKVPGYLKQLAIGDFNGDGKADIAGLSSDGSIWYTTDKSTWTNVPGTLKCLVAVDLNEDGRADLAGLASNGSLWYTTNLATWTNIPGTLSKLYVPTR